MLRHRFLATHYTLRMDGKLSQYAPRNWVFEGSDDGDNWNELSVHTRDSSLCPTSTGPNIYTWAIPPENQAALRVFRVRANGNNATHGSFLLTLNGLELYGDLYANAGPSGATPRASPVKHLTSPRSTISSPASQFAGAGASGDGGGGGGSPMLSNASSPRSPMSNDKAMSPNYII